MRFVSADEDAEPLPIRYVVDCHISSMFALAGVKQLCLDVTAICANY